MVGFYRIDLEEFTAMQKSELEMQQITRDLTNTQTSSDLSVKQKRAFDKIHRITLAAAEGGVRVNRSGSTLHDLKLQGDTDMVNMKNLLKRSKLKDHKHVRKSIKNFWGR